MVYLELSAEILPTKLLEFNQSKLSFINGLHKIKGYSGFREKRCLDFNMQISWQNKSCLEDFMNTEHYIFFRGAIITLSCNYKINKVTNDLNLKKFEEMN
jgi:hypothetical protein